MIVLFADTLRHPRSGVSGVTVILVVGASACPGGNSLRWPLAATRRVRLACRVRRKLDPRRVLGAEIVQADRMGPRSLDEAFSGVDAVLTASHSIMGLGRYASTAVDAVGGGHRRAA